MNEVADLFGIRYSAKSALSMTPIVKVDLQHHVVQLDRDLFREYADRYTRNQVAELLIVDGLAKYIDHLPLSKALNLIPTLIEYISKLDYDNIAALLNENAKDLIVKHQWKDHGYRAGEKAVEPSERLRILSELGIKVVSRLSPEFSTTPKPVDIDLVKTFTPTDIIDPEKYELIQTKMLHEPIVTSSYVGAGSCTYRGVGVAYDPTKILAVFPHDIGSTVTTLTSAPTLSEVHSTPQLADWEGVRRCSDISIAHRLGRDHSYSEIWIQGKPNAVIVRPYGVPTGNFMTTGDQCRSLAAYLLSKRTSLPIRILE